MGTAILMNRRVTHIIYLNSFAFDHRQLRIRSATNPRRRSRLPFRFNDADVFELS
jgi:hypothetical protein